MYMYITIKANTLERLEAIERDIKATLTKLRIKAHTPTEAMREAFQTALPVNHNFKRILHSKIWIQIPLDISLCLMIQKSLI